MHAHQGLGFCMGIPLIFGVVLCIISCTLLVSVDKKPCTSRTGGFELRGGVSIEFGRIFRILQYERIDMRV